MDKKTTELIQTAIFGIIFLGQVFLVSRYYPRDDMVGVTIFVIIGIASAIAAIGHYLEWKKL